MGKRLEKFLVLCGIVVCITFSIPITLLAADILSASPNAKIEYNHSATVNTGTIRYVQQNAGTYWNSSYWSPYGSDTSSGECYSACVSMALSYVGVNHTAGEIVSGGSKWAQSGASVEQVSSVSSAVDRYINGRGKYSPIVIWIPYTSGNHWVLVAGRVNGNTYLIVDPWNGSHGSTWQATINGDTISYWGGTQSIGTKLQYYNAFSPDIKPQPTEKPKNVVIALEKTTFFSNEHVTYYCAGDYTEYYVISIYNAQGKVVETVKVNPGEYCTRYYDPGVYMVYCEAYNSCGNTFSNTIKFTVKEPEKPTNVVLALEKTTFFSGEHVTYYCAGDNVSYYVISIYKIYNAQGNVVETVKVNPGEYCTRYYDPGVYMVYCEAYNSCGNTFSNTITFTVKSSTEISEPHKHDYTSSIKKPATCTEPGIMLYTCKDNDDSYEDTIPATGHQHTELRNVKAATCTQEGYTGDTYCKDCNTRISSGKTIAQKPHTWDAGKVTREATCTETGIKTYTCTGCQMTKTEEIAATGHRNTEYRNAKEATCAEAGYTGDLYCKDCNTKLRNGSAIAKKSHTWDAGMITTMATCTAKGIRTYTCTSCKATKTEEIAATGHQHTEIRNVKAATCAQEGYTGDTYCKDCGTKLSFGQKTNKTEHQWNSGKVTKNATCTEAGIRTYTCTVCESTRMEELPATGHQTKVTKFAKEASCKTEGYTGDIYCQDCGKLLQEGVAIPKLAHTWNTGVITKAATCTEAGVRTFTCAVCGTTRTETVSATGHGALEIRGRREASCAAEGYTGDTYCTVCGRKTATGSSIAKTGHSWNGGAVTKQPTTTETGVRTFTCQKCGTTRTEAIAKLEVPRATPGSVVKDKATNGVYRVLQDGLSVQFMKPITKKKASVKIPERIQVNGISCAVTEIAANAFKSNTSLKSVSIGKNVTIIGTNAFYGCKKLSKVSGGTGIAKIRDKAFYNCGSLTSITIPGTVRSIGKQAFCKCKKLKNITVRTNTLTSIDIGAKAFSGTYKKPKVKVPAKLMKEYKKLFKAKGMSAKAVYKK